MVFDFCGKRLFFGWSTLLIKVGQKGLPQKHLALDTCMRAKECWYKHSTIHTVHILSLLLLRYIQNNTTLVLVETHVLSTNQTENSWPGQRLEKKNFCFKNLIKVETHYRDFLVKDILYFFFSTNKNFH